MCCGVGLNQRPKSAGEREREREREREIGQSVKEPLCSQLKTISKRESES